MNYMTETLMEGASPVAAVASAAMAQIVTAGRPTQTGASGRGRRVWCRFNVVRAVRVTLSPVTKGNVAITEFGYLSHLNANFIHLDEKAAESNCVLLILNVLRQSFCSFAHGRHLLIGGKFLLQNEGERQML